MKYERQSASDIDVLIAAAKCTKQIAVVCCLQCCNLVNGLPRTKEVAAELITVSCPLLILNPGFGSRKTATVSWTSGKTCVAAASGSRVLPNASLSAYFLMVANCTRRPGRLSYATCSFQASCRKTLLYQTATGSMVFATYRNGGPLPTRIQVSRRQRSCVPPHAADREENSELLS